MTVYIIVADDGVDMLVDRVFSSRQKAEDELKTLEAQDDGRSYEIVDREVA